MPFAKNSWMHCFVYRSLWTCTRSCVNPSAPQSQATPSSTWKPFTCTSGTGLSPQQRTACLRTAGGVPPGKMHCWMRSPSTTGLTASPPACCVTGCWSFGQPICPGLHHNLIRKQKGCSMIRNLQGGPSCRCTLTTCRTNHKPWAHTSRISSNFTNARPNPSGGAALTGKTNSRTN